MFGQYINIHNKVMVTFVLNNGAHRSLIMNDFSADANGVPCIYPERLNKMFKAFMYFKFGNEYKNAFNENLRKKYEEEMIK